MEQALEMAAHPDIYTDNDDEQDEEEQGDIEVPPARERVFVLPQVRFTRLVVFYACMGMLGLGVFIAAIQAVMNLSNGDYTLIGGGPTHRPNYTHT